MPRLLSSIAEAPQPMLVALAAVAAALYLLAAARAWHAWSAGLAWLVPAALVLHAAVLIDATVEGGQLALGVTEALSVFAWQAAAVLWVVCLIQPLQILGVAIYPLAAASALWAVLWPTSIAAIPLTDWKLQSHVILSVFSLGLLSIAAAQAVTLFAQDLMLHRHAPNRIVQALPPLQTMEHLLFVLILLGFFVLSLSLLSGLLFVDDLFAQHLAHKTVLSVAAWAMFGTLLWGRWRRGWRGRTAIRWTLGGYGVLVLAYFGSKVVLEQMLSRHWT